MRRVRNAWPPAAETRPMFMAGQIDEPRLLFGGGHQHIDPKAGLSLYGPYSLHGQDAPSISAIRVGVVSTGSLITATRFWLKRCQQLVVNDGSQPFLFPPFPGLTSASTLHCDLVFGSPWQEHISDNALAAALAAGDYYERLGNIVELFAARVRNLSERSPRPDVIICAMPQSVLDLCTVESAFGEVRRIRLTTAERRARAQREAGQLSFLPVAFGDESEEPVAHRNLRRALKAETMAFGIPTQMIRESTLTGNMPGRGRRTMQDEATRAWNFCTGLYYKAGGHPWRLADMPTDTCYIGISFYRERLTSNPLIRTSLAQIFSHRGDGLVLRGRLFEWAGPSPSPHMPEDAARHLMQEAIDLYARHSERPPLRVVVHKSSRYWEDELRGFEEGLKEVPRVDLVALEKRGTQFFRRGDYPPLRGTWVRFDESDYLLYTRGFIPFLRTYPGMRVPQPIEMVEHHGDTPAEELLHEIMALTKMNWNSADFASEEPMTLAFARKVGEILGEMPAGMVPQSEYRYYM